MLPCPILNPSPECIDAFELKKLAAVGSAFGGACTTGGGWITSGCGGGITGVGWTGATGGEIGSSLTGWGLHGTACGVVGSTYIVVMGVASTTGAGTDDVDGAAEATDSAFSL